MFSSSPSLFHQQAGHDGFPSHLFHVSLWELGAHQNASKTYQLSPFPQHQDSEGTISIHHVSRNLVHFIATAASSHLSTSTFPYRPCIYVCTLSPSLPHASEVTNQAANITLSQTPKPFIQVQRAHAALVFFRKKKAKFYKKCSLQLEDKERGETTTKPNGIKKRTKRAKPPTCAAPKDGLI